MNRHFLAAISDDPSAQFAVRFLGTFFGRKDDLECTLLYVAPRLEGSTAMGARPNQTELAKGAKALDAARDRLVGMGWNPRHIHLKTLTVQRSTALDIVNEAERGRHDAVVLGRRGLSTLEEHLGESLSAHILDKSISFPLWLCRLPEADRLGVLCCVDGSEQAYRIVDHVGFILSGRRKHAVTLCTVRAGEGREAEKILALARESLRDNGVDDDLIHLKILESASPAKALRKEIERSKPAVVALGRTGAGGGTLRQLFFGSVSQELIQHAAPAAVWVSR